jgi:hypothetical protein
LVTSMVKAWMTLAVPSLAWTVRVRTWPGVLS